MIPPIYDELRRVTVYGFSGAMLTVEKVKTEELDEVVEHFKKHRHVRSIFIVWMEVLHVYGERKLSRSRMLNWEREHRSTDAVWYQTDSLELCSGCPPIDPKIEDLISKFRAECDASDAEYERFRKEREGLEPYSPFLQGPKG